MDLRRSLESKPGDRLPLPGPQGTDRFRTIQPGRARTRREEPVSEETVGCDQSIRIPAQIDRGRQLDLGLAGVQEVDLDEGGARTAERRADLPPGSAAGHHGLQSGPRPVAGVGRDREPVPDQARQLRGAVLGPSPHQFGHGVGIGGGVGRQRDPEGESGLRRLFHGPQRLAGIDEVGLRPKGMDLEDDAVRLSREAPEGPLVPQPGGKGGNCDWSGRHAPAHGVDEDGVVGELGLGAVVVDLDLADAEAVGARLLRQLSGEAGEPPDGFGLVREAAGPAAPALEAADAQRQSHGPAGIPQGLPVGPHPERSEGGLGEVDLRGEHRQAGEVRCLADRLAHGGSPRPLPDVGLLGEGAGGAIPRLAGEGQEGEGKQEVAWAHGHILAL